MMKKTLGFMVAAVAVAFALSSLLEAQDFVPGSAGGGDGGASAQSLANAAVMSVTGVAYYQITAAGVQTNTVASSTVVGRMIAIENVTPGSTNITFADNGTTMALGSNAVLGNSDILYLICSASNQWRKVALADN
jgi:hypothetical protein